MGVCVGRVGGGGLFTGILIVLYRPFKAMLVIASPDFNRSSTRNSTSFINVNKCMYMLSIGCLDLCEPFS